MAAHRFESMRKRRKHFVIFRDSSNRKLTSLAELKVCHPRLNNIRIYFTKFSRTSLPVQAEGIEVDESCFKTANCNEIVGNKVGL